MTEKTPLPFGFPLEGIPLAGGVAVSGTVAGVDVAVPAHLLTNPPKTLDGLPVAGYKPQNSENVAMVNRNKELEERVLRQIDKHKSAGQSYDQRFVSLAQTYIQVGFMLLNRGVFQPERIALPEDAA